MTSRQARVKILSERARMLFRQSDILKQTSADLVQASVGLNVDAHLLIRYFKTERARARF